MTTIHYARLTTGTLSHRKNDYVKKKKSPNVPQAWGIEKFWALCKNEYKKRKQPPKNLRGFTQIWSKILTKVAKKLVNHM